MTRVPTSLKLSAVSRTLSTSSLESWLIESRCLIMLVPPLRRRLRRPSRPGGPGLLRPCGWVRSSRRSRLGSEARGAPGRPVPPAGWPGAGRSRRAHPWLVDLGSLGPHPDVVPVKGDVKGSDRHHDALDALDLRGQAPGQVVAPGGDAGQDDPSGSLVPLQDLVGDPGERSSHLPFVQKASVLDEVRHPEGPDETRTPRGCRGAYAYVNPLVSLPGLAGPDLKGKFCRHQDTVRSGGVNADPGNAGVRTPRLCESGPRPGGRTSAPAELAGKLRNPRRNTRGHTLAVGRRRRSHMNLGPTELIIILAIVLLLFGSRKLPDLARSLGKSSKEFKRGMAEGASEDQDNSKVQS